MTDETDSPVPLAAGRSCGECVACCITPRITAAEFNKPANVKCEHCTGSGCAIHDARPTLCRTFFCAWRQSAQLDDSWRPDRSGVILFSAPVEGYAEKMGLVLMLTEDEASIRRPYFVPFVADLVRQRRAVFMTVNDRRALINPYLEPLLAAGPQAVLAQLLRLCAGAYSDSPFLPD